MRISILGTRGYPSSYGGFETLVRHLAPYLHGAGHDVTVFDRSSGAGRYWRSTTVDGIRLVRSLGLSGSTTSTLSHGLSSAVLTAAERPDVALIMNVANGFFLPLLRARGVPTVLNVDGIEWERAKWSPLGRRVFRAGASATARWADQLISDSAAIAERWWTEFGRESTFIPYGGDSDISGVDPSVVKARGLEPGGYVLIVARFVPENNVVTMVEAGRRTGYPVVVVGSNPGSALETRLMAQHSPPAVRMLGHVSDQKLLSSLWAYCGVYLHGHSVGGTNPALVQALGMGAPTIALDTVYNREVLERDESLRPLDAAAIAERAQALLASPSARQEAAARGRDRVADVYNWASVCKAYEESVLLAAERRRRH
jgi:glycosyltransferase involved in cell wall biosynthesis